MSTRWSMSKVTVQTRGTIWCLWGEWTERVWGQCQRVQSGQMAQSHVYEASEQKECKVIKVKGYYQDMWHNLMFMRWVTRMNMKWSRSKVTAKTCVIISCSWGEWLWQVQCDQGHATLGTNIPILHKGYVTFFMHTCAAVWRTKTGNQLLGLEGAHCTLLN